jgi:hypothetical protein
MCDGCRADNQREAFRCAGWCVTLPSQHAASFVLGCSRTALNLSPLLTAESFAAALRTSIEQAGDLFGGVLAGLQQALSPLRAQEIK